MQTTYIHHGLPCLVEWVKYFQTPAGTQSAYYISSLWEVTHSYSKSIWITYKSSINIFYILDFPVWECVEFTTFCKNDGTITIQDYISVLI